MKSDKKQVVPFSVDYSLQRDDVLKYVEFILNRDIRSFELLLAGFMLPAIILDLSVGRWLSAAATSAIAVLLLFPRLQAILLLKFLPTYKALLDERGNHTISITYKEIQKEASGMSRQITFDADLNYALTDFGAILLKGKTPVFYVPRQIFNQEQWTALSDLVSSNFKLLKPSRKGVYWLILGIVLSVVLAYALG